MDDSRAAARDAVTTLHTPRLSLRPWRLEDAPLFHRLWGDPQVIWWGHDRSVEASSERLAQYLTEAAAPGFAAWWAVFVRESGALAGNVLLRPAPHTPGEVEVGYHFSPAARGQGYATEAARALCQAGFDRLGLARIVAVVHTGNAASHAVMRRLGFEPAGEVEHAGMPHVRYALMRPGEL